MIYTIYTIPQPNPYKILLLMMLECSYANSDRISSRILNTSILVLEW